MLKSPRLVLRALRPEDAELLRAVYLANRDRFSDSFVNAFRQMKDRAGGQAYVAAKIADWQSQKGFWFGVWLAETLVGQIQLKNIDWDLRRAELAYLIDRASEGQGFISEAAGAILRVAFVTLRLNKVFIRTIAGNLRSESVARRFGFRHEGLLRQEYLDFSGKHVDLNYFGLLASEYAKI